MNPQQIARIVQNEINKGLNNVQNKTFYRGIVDAATGNKANVTLEGSTYPVMNIICLDGYLPVAGDQVIVVSIGNSGANYFVLGKTDLNYTPVPPESATDHWLDYRGVTTFVAQPATFTNIPYGRKIKDTSSLYTASTISIPENGLYTFTGGLRVTQGTQGTLRAIYELTVYDENDNFNQEMTKRLADAVSGGTSRGGTMPAVLLGTADMELPKNFKVRPRLWQNIEAAWTVDTQVSFGDTHITMRKVRSASDINLISNGQFFLTTDPNWSAPAGNTLTADTIAGPHGGGTGVMRINNTGTSKTAQYAIAIKPGRTYKVKCWARSSVANASLRPNYVNLNNMTASALPILQMPTANTWYQYETTFTASADRTHIQFVVQMTGGIAYLDDIEMYEL